MNRKGTLTMPNNRVANGETLTPPEQEAFSLSKAAIMLDQSRRDKKRLAAALENNMELWVAIRMLASRDDSGLAAEVRDNLIKLSQFVAETTMNHGVDISTESVDTLINVNLQISEGLLEGAKHYPQQ